MTHLSDFSFLQRATYLTYLLIWYTHRVWSLDRFRCLRWAKLKSGELKGIVTILLFFMIPCQLVYECTTIRVKYDEGFASLFGHVYPKPEFMWTEADKRLIIPTNYSLCIGFALQTGTLLLLQCFWNYLSTAVAKRNFMSSKEFKLYVIWTILTIIAFPFIQFNFTRSMYDPTYKEIMPELVYSCGLFIIALLGVRSNWKFNKLLSATKQANNYRSMSSKIHHFQELNRILTVALFIYSISLIILCADGLTGKKTLNAHKFSADFLICNTNVASIITWTVLILIFHPKPTHEAAHHSTMAATSPSHVQKNTTSTAQQDPGLVSTITIDKHASTILIDGVASGNNPYAKYHTAISPYYANPVGTGTIAAGGGGGNHAMATAGMANGAGNTTSYHGSTIITSVNEQRLQRTSNASFLADAAVPSYSMASTRSGSHQDRVHADDDEKWLLDSPTKGDNHL